VLAQAWSEIQVAVYYADYRMHPEPRGADTAPKVVAGSCFTTRHFAASQITKSAAVDGWEERNARAKRNDSRQDRRFAWIEDLA
jgi:hypothetical protein